MLSPVHMLSLIKEGAIVHPHETSALIRISRGLRKTVCHGSSFYRRFPAEQCRQKRHSGEEPGIWSPTDWSLSPDAATYNLYEPG